MARMKGTGNLQMEKNGRWTLRVCVRGRRHSRSTGTTDRAQAERYLERFLAPLGLDGRRAEGAHRRRARGSVSLERGTTTTKARRLCGAP